MLGRTASNLFWMARHMERAENIARLTDVGYRIAMTPSRGEGHREEWRSTLVTAGCEAAYFEKYDQIERGQVMDFLLLDMDNPTSVKSCLSAARHNARTVRIASTREMWESVNSTWLEAANIKPGTMTGNLLPEYLDWIRQRSASFRGALLGTKLRNDGFYFCDVGTFVERADNTARILDVKYYVLLPRNEMIGGSIDTYQWSTILRSVSAHRSYRWVYRQDYRANNVAEFLILRKEMPRSLAHCYQQIRHDLRELDGFYQQPSESQRAASDTYALLRSGSIDSIMEQGLHEFLDEMLLRNNALANQLSIDYNFGIG